jgi:hypothetical protein
MLSWVIVLSLMTLTSFVWLRYCAATHEQAELEVELAAAKKRLAIRQRYGVR